MNLLIMWIEFPLFTDATNLGMNVPENNSGIFTEITNNLSYFQQNFGVLKRMTDEGKP